MLFLARSYFQLGVLICRFVNRIVANIVLIWLIKVFFGGCEAAGEGHFDKQNVQNNVTILLHNVQNNVIILQIIYNNLQNIMK